MADDIDDLLDEFDDLLDKSRSSIKPKQKSSSKNISSSKKVTRNEDKNLKRLAVTLRAFQGFFPAIPNIFCRFLLCVLGRHPLILLFNSSNVMPFNLSSQVKNTDRDELHDMIRECMDDGPDIPELSTKVTLTNILHFTYSSCKRKMKRMSVFPLELYLF